MALSGINSVGRRERKPSALEQIALGVDIASKVLGAGLQTYSTIKGVGEAQDKLKQSKENIDLNRAQLFKAATPEEIQAGKAEDVPGVPGKWVYREKPESALDMIAKSLSLQKAQGDLSNQKTTSEKNRMELQKAQEEAQFGKPLSETAVKTLSEAKSLPSKMAELDSIIEKNSDLFGPIAGRSGALNPYNEKAQTINSKIKSTAQAIGKYMEGGVLRAEDVPKYAAMLPNLSDTKEVAKNKTAIVQKMLMQKFIDDAASLKDSGYDTRAFEKHPLKTLSVPSFVEGQQSYDQDVLDYAKSHGISADQALKIKQMRTQ